MGARVSTPFLAANCSCGLWGAAWQKLKWDLLWRCTSSQLGNPQQRESSVNSPRWIQRQTEYWCCSNKMKWLTCSSCSSSSSGVTSRKACQCGHISSLRLTWAELSSQRPSAVLWWVRPTRSDKFVPLFHMFVLWLILQMSVHPKSTLFVLVGSAQYQILFSSTHKHLYYRY